MVGSDIALAIGDRIPLELSESYKGADLSLSGDGVASLDGSLLVINESGSFSVTATRGDKEANLHITSKKGTLSYFVSRSEAPVDESLTVSPRSDSRIEQLSGFDVSSAVRDGSGNFVITGFAPGASYYHLVGDSGVSKAFEVSFYDSSLPRSISLSASDAVLPVGGSSNLKVVTYPSSFAEDVEIEMVSGEGVCSIEGTKVIGLVPGTASFVAHYGSVESNRVDISVFAVEDLEPEAFRIDASAYDVEIGDSIELRSSLYPNSFSSLASFAFSGDVDSFSFEGTELTALSAGEIEVRGRCGNAYSENVIRIASYEDDRPFVAELSASNVEPWEEASVSHLGDYDGLELVVVDGTDGIVELEESGALKVLKAESKAVLELRGPSAHSNPLTITTYSKDPYEGVNPEAFYGTYTRAYSDRDAYYRSRHGLLSGDIAYASGAPFVVDGQPMDGTNFVRNSGEDYIDEGSGYRTYDSTGRPSFDVYLEGGYISLEDVAAYIYAFGDVPANYDEDRSADPKTSIWGEYLRANNTSFSGNTDRYPYEPELPRIYGCGGDLRYYEVDIGNAGYNSGISINRGSLRIVYSRFYLDGTHIEDLADRYVFYTYNHYSDFQEYLNYRGGWGERFGKETAGGQAGSSTGPAPSPYVEVTRRDISSLV